MTYEIIERNLAIVEEKISIAANRSGRKREEIRLIVVSKAQPAEKILEAYRCGVRYFGENYPEETAEKLAFLTEITDIEWHMIGHLQSRKAKIVAEYFHMLHSLDSLHTAEKLERLLEERDKTLPVLIEINTGGEESKSGLDFSPAGTNEVIYQFVEQVKSLKHINICGLMTMPPLGEVPEKARGYFKQLRLLKDDLRKHFPDISWRELSMGTSADYETAVEEGSTMVRIGSAILGERIYQSKA